MSKQYSRSDQRWEHGPKIAAIGGGTGLSTMLRGEYGQHGVFAGVPCIVGRNGVRRVLPLNLSPEETEKFNRSCETLENSYRELNLL